jgi:hypothetical protein
MFAWTTTGAISTVQAENWCILVIVLAKLEHEDAFASFRFVTHLDPLAARTDGRKAATSGPSAEREEHRG